MPDPLVLMADLAAEYRSIRRDIDAAVAAVLASGSFILGERVAAFEREFGAWLGEEQEAPHVVGCASGTEAIALALRALGIGPGKTVATAANSCAPSAAGIRMTGAALGFVDADPIHLLLDPQRLSELIARESVDAVVPVHLFGNPAPMAEILALCRPRGIVVVEDCAQSHGARIDGRPTGTFGDAAAFSFYPSKNLGAYGDAGCVATFDGRVAERLRRLRNYGYDPSRRDWAVEEGLNSRMDELQAAILSVKLRHLESWNDGRRRHAGRYDAILAGVPDVRPVLSRPGDRSSFHLYVVRTDRREALAAHLAERGVQTQIHYRAPVHLQPAYQASPGERRDCPVAERAAREVLSLPVHPFLSEAGVARVEDALASFARTDG